MYVVCLLPPRRPLEQHFPKMQRNGTARVHSQSTDQWNQRGSATVALSLIFLGACGLGRRSHPGHQPGWASNPQNSSDWLPGSLGRWNWVISAGAPRPHGVNFSFLHAN